MSDVIVIATLAYLRWQLADWINCQFLLHEVRILLFLLHYATLGSRPHNDHTVVDHYGALIRLRSLYMYNGRAVGFLDRDACLLYTSDAADDLLCVDLGGRRIIKFYIPY